jgi:small subunit ribosomal protein S1
MKRNESGEMVPDYESTIKSFKEGDVVSGKVVRVDRDEVLVDIGYKSEGVIPARELSVRYGVSPEEVVKVGDTIDALVLQKEDKEGRLILSKKRAEYERVWQRLEAIKEIDGTIKGEVIEAVKGGLIVDIGIRGFVPASLADVQRVKNLKQYIGEEFECEIVELNKARNNVVLSRRAFLESQKKEEKKKLLAELEKGQVVTGVVSSIVNFGAFVDIGGLDGLVHISELSWSHVDHPSEILSAGDEVKVEIIDVDREKGRVSLGLKQTQPDPWRDVVKRFKTGEIIEGTVTKLVPFGAFIEVAEGVEGLIHISELCEKRIEFPEEVVKLGEMIKVKVVDVDLDRRRLSLSLKQAAPRQGGVTGEGEPVAEVPVGVEETKEVAETEEKPGPEEEHLTEITLREVEKVERDVEPVQAEKIVQEEREEKTSEPGSLESVVEQMKKEAAKQEEGKESR